MGPPPFSPGLPAFEFTACTYLVPPGIVTFVNSNDTVGKMSQSIQAVGSLLQSPKSDILMVRNPGKQRELSASVRGPASSGRPPPRAGGVVREAGTRRGSRDPAHGPPTAQADCVQISNPHQRFYVGGLFPLRIRVTLLEGKSSYALEASVASHLEKPWTLVGSCCLRALGSLLCALLTPRPAAVFPKTLHSQACSPLGALP